MTKHKIGKAQVDGQFEKGEHVVPKNRYEFFNDSGYFNSYWLWKWRTDGWPGPEDFQPDYFVIDEVIKTDLGYSLKIYDPRVPFGEYMLKQTFGQGNFKRI